jgi:hypothetical protein
MAGAGDKVQVLRNYGDRLTHGGGGDEFNYSRRLWGGQ